MLLNHEPLITIYTEHIGSKSFTLGYELHVNNELFAKGKSIQVCFDASIQQSILVPDQMRMQLERIIRE